LVYSTSTQNLVTLTSDIPEMIVGIEIENGSCDPDQTLLGVVCHP